MAKKFIVACGGTGGHAFPGIAVAEALAARGHETVVWDSGRDIESQVLKSWRGEVFTTGARPLRQVFSNGVSFFRCWREAGKFAPDAILAMGSYSSLPPVLAAAVRRVPIVLHEANAVPGRAVDFLSRFAKAVAVSFPSAGKWFPGRRVEPTGMPVRSGIAGERPFDEVPPDAFTVFVTGGSQGAHRVNEIASRALALVHADLSKTGGKRLFVIHQTGFADEGEIMRRYASAGISARVAAFEREMGRAFATADLVIARAGASTCFELAAAGKPAFFIPLPSALRNHQHFNATAFVDARAADEGLQNALTPRTLANYILGCIRRPEKLAAMAANMKSMAVPDAAERVANLVESVCI